MTDFLLLLGLASIAIAPAVALMLLLHLDGER